MFPARFFPRRWNAARFWPKAGAAPAGVRVGPTQFASTVARVKVDPARGTVARVKVDPARSTITRR